MVNPTPLKECTPYQKLPLPTWRFEYLFDHLQSCGAKNETVTIQTDNGKAFATWQVSPKQTLFEKIISANINDSCCAAPYIAHIS